MNLVGQAAGYLGARQPAPKPKQGGGGMHMPGMLNPLQFRGAFPGSPGTVPGVGGGGSPWAAGGEAGAGLSVEELAPLALAL